MSGLLGLSFAPGITGQARLVRILGFALIVIALLGLSYCKGRQDGSTAVKLEDQKAVTAAVEKQRKADEAAANKRVADALAQQKVKADYEQAIAAAPGGVNSPAAVAFACRRLVRAGYSGEHLPAECRR